MRGSFPEVGGDKPKSFCLSISDMAGRMGEDWPRRRLAHEDWHKDWPRHNTTHFLFYFYHHLWPTQYHNICVRSHSSPLVACQVGNSRTARVTLITQLLPWNLGSGLRLFYAFHTSVLSTIGILLPKKRGVPKCQSDYTYELCSHTGQASKRTRLLTLSCE